MRFFFCLLCLPLFGVAQFAPPAGQTGTTAMYKDSSAFIHWATFCNVTRGLQDISNSSSGYPTVGDSSKAIGIADNSVVSLGDGGYAVCTFQYPLTDGPGADFAVFENSFSDDYLEFGFVEVSSDGVNFFRFPATCNIEDTVQTASFGTSDATLVNNLGGKYRALYGTPFDLQELAGTPGLNVNNITHIKVIDVVGSINTAYATYDKNNHKVNDPWPTAFASSGFDLDAVGVIHDITNSVQENLLDERVLFPNPTNGARTVQIRLPGATGGGQVFVLNVDGETMPVKYYSDIDAIKIEVSHLLPGMYFIHVGSKDSSIAKKLIITK